MEIIFTILNIIKYLIYIVIILAIVVFLFLNFSPVFGGSPDKDSNKLIQSSRNFVDGKFLNIKTLYTNSRSSEKSASLLNWISPPKDKNPLKPLPTKQLKSSNLTPGKFAWLGHSTLLMNTDGIII
ncbi:uncharacterized protein METZ01_LOCUS343244, partial [marine metagenome]